MRPVPVDLVALESVFDCEVSASTWWLDLETGEVFAVDVDADRRIDAARRRMESSRARGGTLTLATALAAQGASADEQQALLKWHDLRSSCGRLLPVPPAEAKELAEDRHEFVARLEPDGLRGLLATALAGARSQRRFLELLADDPGSEQRWLAFQSVRRRARIAAWLECERIEPVGAR